MGRRHYLAVLFMALDLKIWLVWPPYDWIYMACISLPASTMTLLFCFSTALLNERQGTAILPCSLYYVFCLFVLFEKLALETTVGRGDYVITLKVLAPQLIILTKGRLFCSRKSSRGQGRH